MMCDVICRDSPEKKRREIAAGREGGRAKKKRVSSCVCVFLIFYIVFLKEGVVEREGGLCICIYIKKRKRSTYCMMKLIFQEKRHCKLLSLLLIFYLQEGDDGDGDGDGMYFK